MKRKKKKKTDRQTDRPTQIDGERQAYRLDRQKEIDTLRGRGGETETQTTNP